MEKRHLAFFVIAMLVIYATMYYMRLTTSPPARRPAPAPGQVAETPTTDTLAQAPAPAVPGEPAAQTPVEPEPLAPAPEVTLKTDVYDLTFTARGGLPIRWDIIDERFVKAAMLERKNGRKPTQPGVVADETATATQAREHLIDSALIEDPMVPRPFETVLRERFTNQFYNEFNRGVFNVERLGAGGGEGVRFTSKPSRSGLAMVKTYRFQPGAYTGTFTVELRNGGTSTLVFDDGGTGLGVTLGPGLGPAPKNGGMLREYTNTVLLQDSELQYFDLKEPGENKLASAERLTWGGVQNKFFMTTLIPAKENPATTAKALIPSGLPQSVLAQKDQKYYPTLELYSPAFTIKPGQTLVWNYEWFAGPKQRDVLAKADHNLDRVLFYSSWGWMRTLCLGLMALLSWLHTHLHNWGLAIISTTIIVRLLMFPLVQKGMKSQAKAMAEQARIKPLIDKLNERFKDDPQRKQAEIFKLYKEHGINPLGSLKGCIWMMIQLPIFIALYNLLGQSIDLRGADFLWIRDLSAPDRLFTLPFALPLIGRDFNLLPIITAATQMLVSKVGMTPTTDPQQQQMQKMMVYFMPIFIMFITYGFQAGLMLYWLISNLWQGVQQYVVNKHMKKPPTVEVKPAPAKAKA